jgi:hypothetical protein
MSRGTKNTFCPEEDRSAAETKPLAANMDKISVAGMAAERFLMFSLV